MEHVEIREFWEGELRRVDRMPPPRSPRFFLRLAAGSARTDRSPGGRFRDAVLLPMLMSSTLCFLAARPVLRLWSTWRLGSNG